MTRSALHRGKGASVDPFSAAGLAANVVDILWSIGTPIAGMIKSRLVKRRLRKAIKRVSSNFVAEHPTTAKALAASADAIAHELARLTDAGRPLPENVLAEQWAASGHLDRADAFRYAGEYVQTLHDQLLKVDGFTALFEAGAIVTAAEILRRLEEESRAREERAVAASYYDAANEYVHAALRRLEGDEPGAIQSAYDARSFIEKAELNGDWRVIERSKGLRARFKELVEERYDELESACATGDGTTAALIYEALEQGSAEFKALVKQRLLEISAPSSD
jgi:hypothetical protein